MEFKIERDRFFKEIQKVQNITPIKGTKPILSYFLLESVEDGLYLFATDLDVGIKTFMNAEVISSGQICIPAKVVYDIIRELPDKSSIHVVLEENNRLRFSCMNSLFHVPCITASEFPLFPQFEDQHMYPIPLKTLFDMFTKVNVAVPVVEQKLYNAPAGALFTTDGSCIEMAGTDGHRMAYIHMEGIDFPLQVTTVLPKKLLDELPKFITDWEKNIQKDTGDEKVRDLIDTCISGNHIIFSWPNTWIFARLLENRFPDYKEPIEIKQDKLVNIDKERFRQGVRRVSLISEKKEWFIRFILTEGKLVLDSESSEIGDAHDEIEVEYQGEPLEIGFNPRYILDFISVIDSPEVSLEMTDNESLAIIRPKDRKNIKFIIMPVRL